MELFIWTSKSVRASGAKTNPPPPPPQYSLIGTMNRNPISVENRRCFSLLDFDSSFEKVQRAGTPWPSPSFLFKRLQDCRWLCFCDGWARTQSYSRAEFGPTCQRPLIADCSGADICSAGRERADPSVLASLLSHGLKRHTFKSYPSSTCHHL